MVTVPPPELSRFPPSHRRQFWLAVALALGIPALGGAILLLFFT